jgi:formylglycine-generating enzyme required for sulfatase activity
LIFIPGGRFLMGSDKKRVPYAFDSELPQHEVYVGDFYIAKYPITNAEYKRFLDSTGHQVPDRFWRSGYPYDKANHPVVNVSWHDAVAYCKWLAEVAGKPYRLPSEAEWEKAARGTDGRIYPWGDEWDAKRCNTWEGGQGGTTRVGKYSPLGDSFYDCVDMAGNVWEWTRSLSREYPYNPKDGREDPAAVGSRVLRGGSWSFIRDFARCRLPRRVLSGRPVGRQRFSDCGLPHLSLICTPWLAGLACPGVDHIRLWPWPVGRTWQETPMSQTQTCRLMFMCMEQV